MHLIFHFTCDSNSISIARPQKLKQWWLSYPPFVMLGQISISVSSLQSFSAFLAEWLWASLCALWSFIYLSIWWGKEYFCHVASWWEYLCQYRTEFMAQSLSQITTKIPAIDMIIIDALYFHINKKREKSIEY